jgi:exodeoxyribonuclease V alpha subunit
VFAAFCAAGLWPGLGSTLAGELAAAGIRGPDDVTATALATLPKVGRVRAGRLVSAFVAAGPAYQVAELLVSAQLPARWAHRVIELFGPGAHRLLRDDPWRLLQVTGVDVPDADALARVAIAGVSQSDPRRSRALVGFALARAARDGHTVWPAAEVAHDLQLYRVADTDAAVADAVAGAQVHAVRSGASGDGGADGADGEQLLALARYFAAERQIADSVHRLAETAIPIGAATARRSRRLAGDSGLDQVQASAVANALAHGVSVLTGGPGTG